MSHAGRVLLTALKRVGVSVVFALLILVNLDALVVVATTVSPPPPSEVQRGDCWRAEHRGQHVMYLAGDAYSIGECNGRLATEIMVKQERALHGSLDRFVPLTSLQRVMLQSIRWVYRGLPDHMTVSEKREIAGIADGYTDPNRATHGDTYTRILYYHAIHDVSQAMVDNPLLACTAFAATPDMTRNGHTLLGRVFDFEGGPVFDEDKVIAVYAPTYGVPFVSVIWAGKAGAVTGMNAEGLAIVLNAAGSDHRAVNGTPTTLLLRRMLQHARSIDDAVQIARETPVFVTDIFTLADGDTGEVARLEITPQTVRVQRGEAFAKATNHLVDPAFDGDGENAWRMLEGTTVSRYNRLSERLVTAQKELTPLVALDVLRDRKLMGDRPAPLGHRGTIDALIATHAVIFDATTRRFWVSSAPHTLGEFVEYDLRELLKTKRLTDHGALPADPLVASGGWERYAEAMTLMHTEDLDSLKQALLLAPDHPGVLRRLAEACEAADDAGCERAAWERLLEIGPPHRKHRQQAEARLEALDDE